MARSMPSFLALILTFIVASLVLQVQAIPVPQPGLVLRAMPSHLVADPLKQAVHSEPDSNSEPHGLTKRLEEIRLDRDHDVPTITVIPPTNPPAAHAAQPQQPHNLAPLIVTNNGPQGPAPVPLAPAAP